MAAMELELTELDHALEGFHDCGMMGDSEARVELARATAAEIQAVVNGLPELHTTHTQLTECVDVAESLAVDIGGHMGDLEQHSTPWSSNMSCMGHDEDEDEDPDHVD